MSYSESISSCMRFVERMAERNALRPLEDSERARQRLSPAYASALYRRILVDVRAGTGTHIACQRHGASVKAFNAWVTRNGLRRGQ